MYSELRAYHDMTADSDRIATPPKRRRRTYDELAAGSRAAAEKALTRFRQKNEKAKKHEAKARLRSRKLDTRRKIIAGALALEHAKRDPAFREQLEKLLDRYVEGAVERELFGLPPLPEPPAGKGGST